MNQWNHLNFHFLHILGIYDILVLFHFLSEIIIRSRSDNRSILCSYSTATSKVVTTSYNKVLDNLRFWPTTSTEYNNNYYYY